jgi:signal transduction histidine kinase
MQREFVADVSHELRTPLTTLRGNVGLLLRRPPASADVQADILNDMVDESDRLIRLVNDLLIMARADAGRNLVNETIDISGLVEETSRQAIQLDTKRIIHQDITANLILMGDRDALKQILLIGLDNALKHSSNDIWVSLRKVDSIIEIRVKDSGEGISPENLEHVFDRFYKVEDSSLIPGFGLGLSIAKVLVEKMGGSIQLESELGIGSELILTFPAQK